MLCGALKSSVWLVVAAALVASGCSGARMTQVESEVSSLKEELVELRRSQASQRVQFDEFRNRLVVLQDKLESARLAASRSTPRAAPAMPQLPHVVVPAQPAPPRVAHRSIVIGPDNVPHVTDAQRRKRAKRSKRTARKRAPLPAGPAATAAAKPPGGTTAEDRAAGLYRVAKELLDGGRLREARQGFQRFLKKHPSHPLADNAMYWIGETWYAQALWVKAARAFYDVIRRFPQGNKVPAAMLKTALCYRKLGERKDADAVLRELVRLYPKTPAADLARRKL